MNDMGGEFEEFETGEDEIDAMMAAGEAVQVVVPGERRFIDSLYAVAVAPLTRGGYSLTPNLGNVAPSVRVAAPVTQSA